MTTAAPSTALATIQPAFTDPERLALAGYLAGILQLAARVGLDGEVAGVDISAEMQARGLERAARHAASNAEFVHADAQVHDFGAARFDAAHSPLAVMFFADPVAASGFDGRTCGAQPRTALRHESG